MAFHSTFDSLLYAPCSMPSQIRNSQSEITKVLSAYCLVPSGPIPVVIHIQWGKQMEKEQSRNHLTEPVAVVGGGSWGTALANLLAEKSIPVSLWVFEEDLCEEMQKTRENSFYLPGVPLSPLLHAHHNLKEVLAGKRIILMAVPSHVYRQVAMQMLDFLNGPVVIVSATKGIENESLNTMSGIWRAVMPDSMD